MNKSLLSREMSIEEIKECSLGILDYIDELCKTHGLRYYLAGGTLLGAARHKGYIPWDDDIDIMMPRDDYERMLDIWPQESSYSFLTHKNTHNFPYAYGKVIDNRTIKIEPIRKSCQLIGVDVDVFPLDNVPDDDSEAIKYYEEIARIQKKLYKKIRPFGKSKTVFRTIAINVLVLLGRVPELLGINTVEKIVSDFSTLAQRYNSIDTICWGGNSISMHGIREKISKTNYIKTVDLEFEGRKLPAAEGYKIYLTNLYGDYMKLPPIEQQVPHHSYKAFWK